MIGILAISLMAAGVSADEFPAFKHGVWSGACKPVAGLIACESNTDGPIRLSFIRNSTEWIISSSIEGCDKPQDVEKISASSMKSMLAVGDKAAAQVLKSMVNTRLLTAMMDCQIKRRNNAAINDQDLTALVASTNVAGAAE